MTIAPVVGGCAHHHVSPITEPVYRCEQPCDTHRGLPNFACISPVLYRGAQPTRDGFRQLERLGVKTVVNLRSMHDDRPLLEGTSLRYFRLPTTAWGISQWQMRQFLAIVMDPANQPVFVHCQHGSDRTGFVVGGYRLLEQNWDCESVFVELHTFGFHAIWGHIPQKLRTLGQQTRTPTPRPEQANPLHALPPQPALPINPT